MTTSKSCLSILTKVHNF